MAQKKDQKTGKWYYYGKYRINGNYKQYKKRGFNTRREAILEEEKFLNELELKKEKVLFDDLKSEYLSYIQSRVKNSTYTKHLYVLNKWQETFGGRFIQDISRQELQSIVDDLDNNYSKRYVEKLYYTLNAMFKYGLKTDVLDYNPLDKVDRSSRPNELKKEMLFWELDDFKKFIANVDDIQWKAFFSTLYFMGIRKGECIALTWKDIDFESKIMNIDKTSGAKERAKKVKYTPPKTKNSYRKITIPNALLELLKQWNEIESKFHGYSQDSFVFGNDLPIPAETIRRVFDNYIKKTNLKLREDEQIPRIRIHDLRHSHASYLINNMSNGFTDYDIAKRLGDTIETLHNTYAHWFKTKDSKIIEFMDNDITL